jgi:hypothetical protein
MATPVMITNIRWGKRITHPSHYSTSSNARYRHIPFLRRRKRLLLPNHLHLRQGLHREDDLRQRSQAASVPEQCGD